MLRKSPGLKAFNKCELKGVPVSVSRDSIYYKAQAHVLCPTTTDKNQVVFADSHYGRKTPEAAIKSAQERVAKACAVMSCQGCVYIDASNLGDVEAIRQQRARDDKAIFDQREETAKLALSTLSAELAAVAAEQAVTDLQAGIDQPEV